MFTYGFHVADKESVYCFCPCDRHGPADGTVAGRWRTLCDLETTLKEYPCATKKKSPMIQKKPREYLEHVKKKGSSCPYHQILYQFLKLIFKDFYEAGRKHLAFYNAKNKDYKAAACWVKDHQPDTAIPEPASRPLKILQPLKIDFGPGQKSIKFEEAIKTLPPEHQAVVSSAMISSLNTAILKSWHLRIQRLTVMIGHYPGSRLQE